MSNHLPECPTTTDPHGLDDGYACPCECQCEILRACEQRVREEIDREAFVLDKGDPFRQAYRKGLDAAREAVIGMNPAAYLHMPRVDAGQTLIFLADAIAAIDALREEQK